MDGVGVLGVGDGQVDQHPHMGVVEAVVGHPAVTAYRHDPVGAQQPQRVRGRGLTHRRHRGQVAHTQFALELGTRLEPVRLHLLQVARRAGVDRGVPKALGSPSRDVLAALGAATAAVTDRFGAFGIVGPVTAWQVAAACSGGRLLAPGLATAPPRCRRQHQFPLTRGAGTRNPREGCCPAGPGRAFPY
jgi:hypothetical protein